MSIERPKFTPPTSEQEAAANEQMPHYEQILSAYRNLELNELKIKPEIHERLQRFRERFLGLSYDPGNPIFVESLEMLADISAEDLPPALQNKAFDILRWDMQQFRGDVSAHFYPKGSDSYAWITRAELSDAGITESRTYARLEDAGTPEHHWKLDTHKGHVTTATMKRFGFERHEDQPGEVKA